MASEQFKTYFFKVDEHNSQVSLHKNLIDIKSINLAGRLREIAGTTMRIEDIKYHKKLWFIDFVKFRDVNGPGKASRSKPIEGFPLAAGESFCEETTMIYCPTKKMAVIQYSHHGVRHSGIQMYLSTFIINSSFYTFLPKYDGDIQQKFASRAGLKKLSVSLAPNKLTTQDKQQNKALLKVLLEQADENANRINFSYSVGNTKSLLGNKSETLVQHIKKLYEDNPESIKKFEVGIIEALDGQTTILDLIEERLCDKYSSLPTGLDKRWLRQDKYKALLNSYNLHKNLF
tara:strand:+ start:10597 stop:11460 length:864 start_codon:yes stop_codon:yes gene_type:complete